jgi:predicted permease
VNILIVAALHGVIALLWLLAALSRRLGDVTKQPPLYRLLYLSMALVAFGALWQVNAPPRSQERLIADAISLIGLAVALGVVWRYWNWLLYE